MSSINADNGVISGITGIRTTADNTGNLALQSNGVTLLTVTTANTLSVSNVATLSISGATSGAVALAVPAVAGTNTVTIAAQTGTLNAAGPAFSAYGTGGQSLSGASSQKIIINTEIFDTNNNFDSTTNYRFTPTVAGYYQISGGITVATFATAAVLGASIAKNGTIVISAQFPTNGANRVFAGVSSVIYLNGSTDYVELFASPGASTTTTSSSLYGSSTQDAIYFNGCLVRGA
jgi:hypothetical protein